VTAAVSEDGGRTWTFQQKVLELRTTCPADSQPDPNTGVTSVTPESDHFYGTGERRH
jgi:hypothetical protein